MAKGDDGAPRNRVSIQMRLNPRIADEIDTRTKANESTTTREIELLCEKGLMLEKLMTRQNHMAMDVLLRLVDSDPEGALRKMLEYGADHRRLENVIRTFRLNSGIDPMPEFTTLVPEGKRE